MGSTKVTTLSSTVTDTRSQSPRARTRGLSKVAMAFFEIGVELDDEPRAVVETKESDDDRALIVTASALDPTHAPHGSELLDPPLAPQRSHSFEGDSELSSALHRVDGDRDSMLDAIERELYDPSRRRAAAKSADAEGCVVRAPIVGKEEEDGREGGGVHAGKAINCDQRL